MQLRSALALATGVALFAAATARTGAAPTGPAPLPESLRDTGLYEPGTLAVCAENSAFQPRHPLWSDGASKRRWVHLPPGTAIDKSDPDAWQFPAGTRLWKEFAYGRPVETRFIERLADGSWRYAAYAWNEAGTEARLAPADGARIAMPGAPGGVHLVPSRDDCVACHEGAPVPVLGLSAVQAESPIAATTPDEHGALGYLHGNCGHCHNDSALPGVGLELAQSSAAPALSARRARDSVRARAGELMRRFTSTNPHVRMPPIGVRAADQEGIALVRRWIHELEAL